jgi:hypothetical protein
MGTKKNDPQESPYSPPGVGYQEWYFWYGNCKQHDIRCQV